jgi:hypothetical protein
VRLLYLCGEPGVGKTWTMDRLTEHWSRLPLAPEADAPARDALMTGPDGTGAVAAIELGRRRDAFSGTDALPQTVITVAETYLTSGRARAETNLLLAEGARLANLRFLGAAADSGWLVLLVNLIGPELAAERRAKRAAALGRPEQAASWVTGRRTACANLAIAAALLPGLAVYTADASSPPLDDLRHFCSPPA